MCSGETCRTWSPASPLRYPLFQPSIRSALMTHSSSTHPPNPQNPSHLLRQSLLLLHLYLSRPMTTMPTTTSPPCLRCLRLPKRKTGRTYPRESLHAKVNSIPPETRLHWRASPHLLPARQPLARSHGPNRGPVTSRTSLVTTATLLLASAAACPGPNCSQTTRFSIQAARLRPRDHRRTGPQE